MPRPEPHEPACPACAEPLEPGDLYCGACGAAARPVHDEDPAGPGPDGPRAPSVAAPGFVPAPAAPGLRRAPDRPLCVACSLGSVGTDGHCWHCGHAQPRPRDHQEAELESVAAVSDRGLRHHRNEDAFSVSTTWLPDGTPAVVAVVCDGVSSAHRPDDASAAAVEMVNESLLDALEHAAAPEEAMRKALASGAQAVTDLASEDHQGADPFPRHSSPACTCVSAVMTGGVLTIGWVGDSRAYWIPDDRSRPSARLTEDDSWAARMVAAGIMSEQEAYSDVRAHAITGWLGADAVELNPHTATFEPDEPGVVVVCTDGLWNYAESSPELASVVPSDARHRPLQAARALVGVALDGGGHDNITVAVLPFPATISTATAAGAPVGRARSQP